MTYTKQTWTDSPATTTPISASRLGHIEAGIVSTDKGAFASRPASGTNVGDLYSCTDIGNVYQWNGTIWEMWSSEGGIPFTPPPSTGWSALGASSITTGLDSRVNTIASSSGNSLKGELRTLSPTSNYTATFYFNWAWLGTNTSQAGIALKNSGAGQIVAFGPSYDSAVASGWNLQVRKWTNTTTYSADYVTRGTAALTRGMPNWLRVRDDATSRICEYSYNGGVDWVTLHTVSRTDFITSGPDQIGWFCNANNTGGTYNVSARLRSYALT